MIKVHYCPSCGCFYPCCQSGCPDAWQVLPCASCSQKGPLRNGAAYLAAVKGQWADDKGPAAASQITMRLRDGTVYRLTPDGDVSHRSDGPAGFAYSDWRILGFLRRWNSRHLVPLAAAISGADTGHGYVVDCDHGTRRVWGHPPGHRLAALVVGPAQ